ncbi:MAG: GNAT family N-acetyltransferase [Sphingomonadales bacterium]
MTEQSRLAAPAPLDRTHDFAGFSSGVASLDDWLRRRAHPNQASGASRTYVVAEGLRVIAYYCLASGAISLNEAPPKLRRNMPDPLPVAVLGRFAVDAGWQGKGLGVALLRDAVLRSAQAGRIIGIRGIMVHALSDEAKAFYEHHGFVESPANPRTLLLSLKMPE